MSSHGQPLKQSLKDAANGREDATASDSKEELGRIARKRLLTFKISHALISVFFVWLLIVHLLGIYFFAKGFLLTRLILDEKSECHVLPDGSISQETEGCWHPRTFDRAVIILVDALRYDFTVPFQATSEDPSPHAYHDAFTVLYETAVTSPQNAFLLPFIADPPTTTLQRLKGLTTGTLPTFIDAGSNFAGTAIQEDNLVDQLRSAGKTLVHLGDDTWQALFPDSFDTNLTRPYDSFNVRDLHTVDNGVIEHIFPLLAPANTAHWDVIVGHFLGVDHAGHRYGPEHPAMTDKLEQMDKFVRDVVRLIDEQTLLVVMGDHGMDTKGDHGGESDDEVEAAVWMYSKRARFGRTLPHFSTPPRTAKERPVRQIDLVPTLSFLLGTPVPYNNLGRPIDEAFTGPGKVDWRSLAKVNHLTLEQIRRYQAGYSEARELERNPEQNQMYRTVQDQLQDAGPEKWQKLYRACRDWQHETLAMYRRLWAEFTISDMLHGVEILVGAVLVLFVVARLIRGDTASLTPGLLDFIARGVALGAATGAVLGLALPAYFTTFTGVAYGVAVGGIMFAGARLYQKRQHLMPPFASSLWGWLAVIFTISQAAGFASNSYTIHEDSVLLLFLTTFGVLACVSSLRQSSASDRVLGTSHSILFVVLTRMSSFSRLCREEQIPGCRSSFYASSTSSTSAPWHLFIPFVVALVLPEVVKLFYKGTASYDGTAGVWIGFSFRMGLLLVAAYWVIDAADNGSWFADRIASGTIEMIGIVVARSVPVIAVGGGVAMYIWARPCINISISESPMAVSGGVKSKTTMTILGYANTHGSRYFLLLPIFILLVALPLPPMGQFALAICTTQILSLLEILDANALTIDSSTGSTSTVGPIVLAMLGSYHFFKTGHQAVLSSIQWNAAFVGFSQLTYPWSPILVALNTFGAQLLCAIAVPLTVLWKRPIRKKQGLSRLLGDVMQALLTHLLYYAVIQLATTMWAGHLRRHLMLYRVFMPRFLMASVVLVVVDVMLVFVALTGVRVSALSVGEVFGY